MPLKYPGYEASISEDSSAPSPQVMAFWDAAVGDDILIEDEYLGQPARFFSCSVGGALNVKGKTGEYRVMQVVGGATYILKLRAVRAADSTAYGLSVFE